MARWFSLAAAAVRLIGGVIGAVILIHAAFVLFGANPANTLVQFTTSWRDNFGWFTKDLFSTTNPKFGEAINDALAAVIYIVVASLISKLIVRLAPAEKAKAKS
ncbi:hypothetical protein [Petropleomorpha daqingensis]|uniref:Uncharacterized protein n=1 Tax=Petropleomorpha daqingensis TaxID=2026353 RepID=A0A853CE96_9ACTN|nr:hypothetical protein [Petropleomorpha daqingensis]NYJ06144.1 hypothetical protein [Petropleomorpha daqingensis]